MSVHSGSHTKREQPAYSRLSGAFQTNYNSIIEALSQRIKVLYEQDRAISQKFEAMRNELGYARPCDIKISNHDQIQANHEVVKKIVQSAISSQAQQPNGLNSTLSREEQAFQRQNVDMENEIEVKMKSIEQLDVDIKNNLGKEERAIVELERSEEALKAILKAKGSIDEAEKKEKEKKMKINQIRYIKEMLTSLREQKVNRIREVIQCLSLLLQCRQDRSNKIDRNYDYGQKLSMQTTAKLLQNFILNLNYLKQQKNRVTDRINDQDLIYSTNKKRLEEDLSREGSLSKRRSNGSTPKNSLYGNVNPFNLTERKQQKKNYNKLETKKLGNMSTIFTQNSKKYNSIEGVIGVYEQAIKYFSQLREAQTQFFQDKNQRLEQQYRIKAMEKSYLIGILGYDPNQSEGDVEQYQNIINYTVKKCLSFSQILEQKSKEKARLGQTIRSVQQSIEILKSNLQNIVSEGERKKCALNQIENIVQEVSMASNRKIQTKTIQSDIQSCWSRKRILQKQQEQFAQQGDLENYKRINNQIDDLSNRIKQLEKKLKNEAQYQFSTKNVFNFENQHLWAQIKGIMNKFGFEIQIDGLQAKTGPELLGKLNRRLNPI